MKHLMLRCAFCSWVSCFSVPFNFTITYLGEGRACLYASRAFNCLFYMSNLESFFNSSWWHKLAVTRDCDTP